ncbi:retrovirus-related pol polyprotein from transposon TNT 1-94 [Tanacetum coccineum]
MTGDRSRLKNFVKKFIWTVRFWNDHFGAIMGYGDYENGNSVISVVYYVEDTDAVELIKSSRSSNLYTISVEDMMKSSPIFLLSKASKNKSWLWHHRLNYLNFSTINDLARKDLVRGLPRLKFEKDHLKKYILVIVDDFSRFTWVKFLRSKDETPMVVISNFPKANTSRGLNKTVLDTLRTDNGTEFVNKDLTEYYERVGIFHQKTVPRTPQQNDVVERRNRTLVEAARTMLIFSKAPVVSYGHEAVDTAVIKNAPSPSHSPSSLALQSPSLHQVVVAESTLMKDNPFASVDQHPFIKVFAPEPSSEASSSGDLSLAEYLLCLSITLHHLGI